MSAAVKNPRSLRRERRITASATTTVHPIARSPASGAEAPKRIIMATTECERVSKA